MNIKNLIFAVILAAASAGSSAPADNPDNQSKTAATVRPAPLVGNLPNQDKAPSYSSPQETMDPNGDRVSHYPPYYHPEQSGGHHR